MKSDITAAAIIILSLIWAVIWILQPVYAYESHQVRQPTWDMPDIAQCDKELWDRIINGCGENDE